MQAGGENFTPSELFCSMVLVRHEPNVSFGTCNIINNIQGFDASQLQQ